MTNLLDMIFENIVQSECGFNRFLETFQLRLEEAAAKLNIPLSNSSNTTLDDTQVIIVTLEDDFEDE